MSSTPAPTVIRPDRAFAIDTLVEAILDAPDPDVIAVSARVSLRGDRPEPIVVVRLHDAEWELALDAWSRALGEIAWRSRSRSLAAPPISNAFDRLIAAGNLACRGAAAYDAGRAEARR